MHIAQLLEPYFVFYLLVYMFWFDYLTLLQWKVSNHEISLLYITSFGFCCVHRNWSHQTSV